MKTDREENIERLQTIKKTDRKRKSDSNETD